MATTKKLLLQDPSSDSKKIDNYEDSEDIINLSPVEKRFLLLVERGDVANIKRLLDIHKGQPEIFSIDCVDPLGRSGLIMTIENENYELMQLLIHEGVKVKDALLHAIKEEYVEAVELLLEWEEHHHETGTPYSWEAADRDKATFTPDITPLILAAHKNNYEIIKILLDRGATLPLPHDIKCGCDQCVAAVNEDSLRYSRARINAYRALASPSLICLSSKDPFLTAFELSWELRRLAKAEAELRAEYNELRSQCQDFTTTLLGHARTSEELQTLLNHKATKFHEEEDWEPGERQTLDRLKLAINYKQKKFVAHPSVQQLLAAMWYEGLPGFRRKPLLAQIFQVLQLGLMFPLYSLLYMFMPHSKQGKFLKKPFVKFICHSSSYVFFLTLLAAASQKIEFVVLDWFNANDWIRDLLKEWRRRERGALPGFVEWAVIIYIIGWVWTEIKALWSNGLLQYVSDLWNIVDFITNSFYVAWIALRAMAVFVVMRESWSGIDPYYPREQWDMFDPMLLSEGMFAAAMIFSFLKLVHIFSINPHLGPLQISLGRMVVDILKFFFVFILVLFAFGCGLNQLLWYYADLEKSKCYSLPGGLPDYDAGDSCFIWRRFANLFETSQSLFWASFGLVELEAFELTGIKGFTRFWGLTMFGSYSVINIIVLLNMLIAMMSTSYQIISERSDTEWKFARSKLWISYFDEGATVPAPFNILPTGKGLWNMLGCGKKLERRSSGKEGRSMQSYFHVSRLLVRRYVSAEESRKQKQAEITEDDVNEIRQDISSFRYELIDVLKMNGMRTPNLQPGAALVPGRKGKVMERRLMKDFQIGVIENVVREALMSDEGHPRDLFARIARALGARKEKQDWNAVVRRSSIQSNPIGCKQASLKRLSSRRKKIVEENAALFSMDPERLAEYNPKLQNVSAATRVAYAKFKTRRLISHIREDTDWDQEIRSQTRKQSCSSLDNDPGTTSPSAIPTNAVSQSPNPPPVDLIGGSSISLSLDETPILQPIISMLQQHESLTLSSSAMQKDARASASFNKWDQNEEVDTLQNKSVHEDVDDSREGTITSTTVIEPTVKLVSREEFCIKDVESMEMSKDSPVDKAKVTEFTAVDVEDDNVVPIMEVKPSEQSEKSVDLKENIVGTPDTCSGNNEDILAIIPTSNDSEDDNESQVEYETQNYTAIQPSSPYATGRSAVTGQTRTGWL